MTLKFYLKPNIGKFAKLVEQSCGDVFLRVSDNSFYNLRHSKEAAKYLRQEADKCGGVEICLTDANDLSRFANFMMGGCL